MTQPTPYVRQFDFTNFSATYPTGQQPGVHMDAEWNAVGTTLTGVLTNLALIQRDDGALKNGSVGIDQFSSSALALIGSDAFIVAGQWVTGTTYALGSLITNGQTTCYLAIMAHTSTSIAADLTDGKIVRIFDTSGSSGGTPDDDSVSTIKLQDGAVTAAKLASTTVTAGSFGSASAVATFTVDQDGRLTAAGNTTIAINGSAVTGNISGNAANVTGIVSLANGGFGTSNASIAAARTTLGGTTVGVAVFTAVDAAAARTAIGAGTGSGDVTLTGVQTLTNKTLTLPVIASISNSGTVTFPTGTRTLVARDTTDTLTNKTLTAPVISTIVNTGTITLPTATDTLVGRATTDTLTGKTMSGASNTFTNLPISALTGGPLGVGLGGTGGTSFTSGQYLKGAGTGTFTTTATIPSTDITGAVTMAARLTSSGVVVGSGTVDLATSGVSAGAYGSSTLIPIVTVDAYGRVTSVTTTGISGAAGGTVTSVAAGTGLTATPSPIIGAGTLNLADTAVTPASYGSSTQIPIITIDQQGRITSASSTGVSGAAGGTVSLITNTGAGLTLTNAAGPTTNIDVDATVVAKLTATQTLTNKTMSGASNTFSNIPYTALTGNVSVGTGLTGGTLIGTGTISLANTAVSAGTYGIANTSIKATVDAQGRITAAADMPIAVTSIAAMVAIDKTTLANGQHLRVLGFTTAGDGGGGDFVWDDTSTATVNTGTVFQAAAGGTGRWSRIFEGMYIDARWFGVTTDGVSRTTEAQAAYDYATASWTTLAFPSAGNSSAYYAVSFNLTSSYVAIVGSGFVATQFRPTTTTGTVFTLADTSGTAAPLQMRDFNITGQGSRQGVGIYHYSTGSASSGRELVERCQFNNLDIAVSRASGNFTTWYRDNFFVGTNYHFYNEDETWGHAGDITISGGEMRGANKACFYIDSTLGQSGKIVIENVTIQANDGYVLFVKNCNVTGVGVPAPTMRDCWNEGNALGGSITVGGVTGAPVWGYFQNCGMWLLDNTPPGPMTLINSTVKTMNCDLTYANPTTIDSTSVLTHDNARWINYANIPGLVNSIAHIESGASGPPFQGAWCQMNSLTGLAAANGATQVLRADGSANITFTGTSTINTTSQTVTAISGLTTVQRLTMGSAGNWESPNSGAGPIASGLYLAFVFCGRLVSGTAPTFRFGLATADLHTLSQTLSDTGFVTYKAMVPLTAATAYAGLRVSASAAATIDIAGYAVETFSSASLAMEFLNSTAFPT